VQSLQKHHHSASVTVSAVKIAALTQMSSPAYLHFNGPYTLSSYRSHFFLYTNTNDKIQSIKTAHKCCTSQHIIRYTRKKSNLYTVH